MIRKMALVVVVISLLIMSFSCAGPTETKVKSAGSEARVQKSDVQQFSDTGAISIGSWRQLFVRLRGFLQLVFELAILFPLVLLQVVSQMFGENALAFFLRSFC